MIQCFDKGVFLENGQLTETAPVPAARARQNAATGHCPHRGAPLGTHTSAPSSMRAWL